MINCQNQKENLPKKIHSVSFLKNGLVIRGPINPLIAFGEDRDITLSINRQMKFIKELLKADIKKYC